MIRTVQAYQIGTPLLFSDPVLSLPPSPSPLLLARTYTQLTAVHLNISVSDAEQYALPAVVP